MPQPNANQAQNFYRSNDIYPPSLGFGMNAPMFMPPSFLPSPMYSSNSQSMTQSAPYPNISTSHQQPPYPSSHGTVPQHTAPYPGGAPHSLYPAGNQHQVRNSHPGYPYPVQQSTSYPNSGHNRELNVSPLPQRKVSMFLNLLKFVSPILHKLHCI